MDFESNYEIARTAEFIRGGNFSKVALQFPDELLKDSVRVVSALKDKLRCQRESTTERNDDVKDVSFFVMADTAYGSCCVDEVGASHVGADCVVHYGHACLSPTTKLPAYFVFGKAPMSVFDCIKNLTDHAMTSGKPVLVLYGLEYAHLVHNIKEEVAEVCGTRSQLEIQFAEILCSCMNPSEYQNISNHGMVPAVVLTNDKSFAIVAGNRYAIGGLLWELPEGCKMEDYLLFWIGSDNSAFANVVLTYNGCEIVRYDAAANCMVTDLSQQKRILKRRYYLIVSENVYLELSKVALFEVLDFGYWLRQMCDVFIYVSCAQTALLDSKEYLAPVITPFEATLAFNRGQWTGAYVMEFRDLINSSLMESQRHSKEARFSFLQGGYVEDFDVQENNDEDQEGFLALANLTEKALQLRDNPNSLAKRMVKSGAEFLATRSYQGLEIHKDNEFPEPYLIGRSGRAAGYQDKAGQMEGNEKGLISPDLLQLGA
ncbi:Diphthamide synthesis DHP [Parasponia andersonii]|uniref:Diphthamide synthesis DHP n=1 Tax=Parasponia andersonii TaxID=3476 RepID=A0A2P5DWL8_PARAD|nr:Diphthamide synthesis DHP [Parasponia andersonii]